MAKVCDVRPCDTMLRTIDQLVTTNAEHNFFELTAKHKKGVLVSLRLVYCPYCGSRIDETWVEDVRNPRKRLPTG